MKLPSLSRYIGQKVAAVERNRPRAVRSRVFEFAPLASSPHSRKLVILCESRTFHDGCWAAWSWFRFLQPLFELEMFVDGAPTAQQIVSWQRLFPGARLRSLPAFLQEIAAPSPCVARFLAHYPYAGKLALLLALQREGDYCYADADVIAFHSPTELLAGLQAGDAGLYMEEPGCYCVDPWIVEEAERLGYPRHNDLNSGLLLVRQHSLLETAVERLLERWHPENSHRVTEQTIISVLMALNGSQALPSDRYLVSNEGMFFWQRDSVDYQHVVARHYVGNVRHLLYQKAMPHLVREARQTASCLSLDVAREADEEFQRR